MTKEDPVHHLETLASAAGKPDTSLLEAIVADASDEDLIAVGRTIDTRRIIVDTSRLYGEAWSFWSGASPELRKLVRGVSKELLALAIHQALHLERMRDARSDASAESATTRAAVEKEAEEAFRAGITLRDQAYDAMRGATGLNEALRSALDATVGTAETSEGLAQGLSGLAKLLEGWLTNKKQPALVKRLALASLDKEYAEELAAAAKLVQATDVKAGKKAPALKVTQAELDREDGVAILLLGQIIRAFEAGHTRNASVPRLVPISTRRLFNRATRRKGADGGAKAPNEAGEKKPGGSEG